ncbi:MAG: hypothetical protein BMS9Abin02_1936 [Anaerolineae bacterium]|nr:MAG: hypothetical protein BMS9Abin02_1936 [Anaerolineae bacterium]
MYIVAMTVENIPDLLYNSDDHNFMYCLEANLMDNPGPEGMIVVKRKQYLPPKLISQNHMSRVTQKTNVWDDQAVGNQRKDKGAAGAGQGGLTGGGIDSGSNGGSGGLFDNPFDD